MNPDFLLTVIAAIAGFVLKTTLAFGVCLTLSRLVNSPKFRFMIWSAFVYGAAGYWVILTSELWTNGLRASGQPPTMATARALVPASSSIGAWQIPGAWALPLGVTLRLLGTVYLLTLCYLVFHHFKERRHLKWVLNFTSEPPADIAERFKSLANMLRAGRSKLLILSGATSPATFGWLKPTILLPDTCLEADRSELQDILRHELHHVRRRDAIWNGLAMASRGLLFFHPAVWYGVRKMQFDRELACDLAVVSQSPSRRVKYAECLLRFARLNVNGEFNSWGIDFAGSEGHLTVRVHSILAGSKKSPRWVLCVRTAFALTISAIFLGVLPSLAVMLSFAHPLVPRAASAAVIVAPHEIPTRARAGSRVHSPASAAGEPEASALASLSQNQANQPIADFETDPKTGNSGTQSSSGPQLLHRGDASTPGNKGVKSQTISLVEPDAKGQSAKSGDSKQAAVQQTATAALGIYRRLAPLDRH
jgi:beta-lactamase regulating signal transducer with metallopeptidase domain